MRADVCVFSSAISNEIEALKIKWQDVCGRGQKSPKIELRGDFGNCTPKERDYAGARTQDVSCKQKINEEKINNKKKHSVIIVL